MPDLGPQQATPGRYLIYEQRMLLFFFALLFKMKNYAKNTINQNSTRKFSLPSIP